MLGRFGRLDVLVNNAGIGSRGAAEELSIAQDRKVIDVNVLAVRMIKALFATRRSG